MEKESYLKIVIPTYNRPDMLAHLLLSLDGVVGDERLEVVVVDDCSDPSNKNALLELEEKYSGVRFFYSSKNLGGGQARNRGAFASDTKWVWFVDDDDVVSSTSVSRVLDVIGSDVQEKLILLKGNFHSVSGTKAIVPEGKELYQRVSQHGQEVNTSCAIFEFSLLKELGGWDASLVAGQDTDLLLRFSEYTDALVLEDVVVDVFHHSGERVTKDPKKQMVGKIQFLRKHWRRLHWKRSARYIFSLLIFYPYVRRIFE